MSFLSIFEKLAALEPVKLEERMPAESSRKMRNVGYGVGLPLLGGAYLAKRKGKTKTMAALGALGGLSTLMGYAGENELHQRQRQEAELHKKAEAYLSMTFIEGFEKRANAYLKAMQKAMGERARQIKMPRPVTFSPVAKKLETDIAKTRPIRYAEMADRKVR